MSSDDFSDAALVLIGHGSTSNESSSEPVYQHAAALRHLGIFAQVAEGFWKQEPSIRRVLLGVQTPRIFVVPLFISAGHFSEEVIPRELGFKQEGDLDFSRVQSGSGRKLYYCHPVGTHPGMTQVLLASARDVVSQSVSAQEPKEEETTLLILGHGTKANAASRKSVEYQAQTIRSRGIYADVHALFLEEEPLVADWHTYVRTYQVVAVPFFMSEGLHAFEDIPVLLGESESLVQERLRTCQPAWNNPTEMHGHLLWYAPGMGADPRVGEIILDRVREMAQER